MTEKDIARTINKHSVKPIIAVILLILVIKGLNSYVFDNDPISPTLLVLFSIGACLYIFQKVMVELLIENNEEASSN